MTALISASPTLKRVARPRLNPEGSASALMLKSFVQSKSPAAATVPDSMSKSTDRIPSPSF
jgi:hypothetical protein